MALDLNDGATHIIDDDTTRHTSFRVDAGPDYANAGTKIILMDGGEASDFQMHGNSTITMHD